MRQFPVTWLYNITEGQMKTSFIRPWFIRQIAKTPGRCTAICCLHGGYLASIKPLPKGAVGGTHLSAEELLGAWPSKKFQKWIAGILAA